MGLGLALGAALAQPVGGVGVVAEQGLEVVLAAVDDLVVLAGAGVGRVGGTQRGAEGLGALVADLVALRILPRPLGQGVGDGLDQLVGEGAEHAIGVQVPVRVLTGVTGITGHDGHIAVDDRAALRPERPVIGAVARRRGCPAHILGLHPGREEHRIEIGQPGGQVLAVDDPVQFALQLGVGQASRIAGVGRAAVGRERVGVVDRGAGLDLVADEALRPADRLGVLIADRVHVRGGAAGGGHIGDEVVQDGLIVRRERVFSARFPVDGGHGHASRRGGHDRATQVAQRRRAPLANLRLVGPECPSGCGGCGWLRPKSRPGDTGDDRACRPAAARHHHGHQNASPHPPPACSPCPSRPRFADGPSGIPPSPTSTQCDLCDPLRRPACPSSPTDQRSLPLPFGPRPLRCIPPPPLAPQTRRPQTDRTRVGRLAPHLIRAIYLPTGGTVATLTGTSLRHASASPVNGSGLPPNSA